MKACPHRFLLLSFLMARLVCGQSEAQNPFDLVRIDSWPKLKPGRIWGEVPGIAVDEQDRIWVFHRGPEPIQVFSPEGEPIAVPSPQGFRKPHQIRLINGFLWAVDQARQVVEKFSLGPHGKLELRLGTEGKAGKDNSHFDQPTDVAVGLAGDIYVTDGYGNDRVVRFDAHGKFKGEWGGRGKEAGNFRLPHSIVADSKGNLYVADRSNQRIQVFDAEGKFLEVWNSILPWTLWISRHDEIWVCGSLPFSENKMRLSERAAFGATGMVGIPPREQVIMKLDLSGHSWGTWTLPSLQWVHGISLDSQGNLYLSDIQGHHIHKYSPR